MQHPKDATEFMIAVHKIREQGFEDIWVDFESNTPFFPNAAVPISSAIQHYQEKRISIKFDFSNVPSLGRAHLDSPIEATDENLQKINDAFSVIWKFNKDQVGKLVNRYVEILQGKATCEEGVLLAFEWCINETLDNVLVHSGKPYGLVMVQLHAASNHLAVCVSDNGIGIYNSLKNTKHKPCTSVDAITMAIKERVTRDDSIGQGNGLWGLKEITSLNSGRLSITSGSGLILVKGKEIHSFNRLIFLSEKDQGTTVDFQIDLDKPINLPQALGGHQPVNLRMEAIATDQGECKIDISKVSKGTGTRPAAETMRNRVLNLLNEGASRVILDFSQVPIVTSSYADELIGKMIVILGFYQFQDRISLKGMNETMQTVVHRSVALRLAQSVNVPQ